MKLQLDALQVESFAMSQAAPEFHAVATVGCNFTNRCTYTCP